MTEPPPTCPSCGTPVAPGAAACGSCGRQLTIQRKSAGATELMAPFDAPTLISPPAQSGDTLPRAREGMHSRIAKDLIAATAGEYEISRELGRGGMAIVFQAHDLSLDREVAIKVMSPALLDGADAVERFKREAKTAAGLSHPHIIPIHAVRDTGELLFFVMKYVEGKPLDDVIRDTGPLPVPMVLKILSEVAGALAYAHKRGVTHRDVKPANIILDDDGWAVVADFGIAKVAEKKGVTLTGMTVGTPAYMSPEQCQVKAVDGRSDQYSLGIVGFELLSGRIPFGVESMLEMFQAHVSTPPAPVLSVRPDCPPRLAEIVDRMMAKAPEDRFASLDDVVAALGTVQVTESKERTRNSMIALARVGEDDATRAMPSLPATRGAASVAPAAASGTPARPFPTRWVVGAIAAGGIAIAGWIATHQGSQTGAIQTGGPLPSATVVLPVKTVALAPARSTIVVGQVAPLSIRLLDSLDHALGGRPVKWVSANPSIASVDSSGAVHAVAIGSTTVTAESEGKSASATIDVTDKPLVAKSIAVSAPDSVVEVGARITLASSVVSDLGTNIMTPVTWRSSAAEVASIDAATGIVSALKPGVVSIDASVKSGPRASYRLTVVAPRAAAMTVSPAALSLTVGDTVRVQAAATDARGNPLRDRDATWSTDHPDIVQVDRNGRVTGLKDGDARLAAKMDTVTRSIAVSVKKAVVAAAPPVSPSTSAKADSTPDLAAGPTFTEISAGGSTTCGALANDGGLLCWGAASATGAMVQGQLFSKISVGDGHTCALTPAGDAYCWGGNAQGQLGDGTTTARDKPVAVRGGQRFTDISVGAQHTCALAADGSAYCWGANKDAQLGNGQNRNSPQPVIVQSTAGNMSFSSIAAGAKHTCAVSRGRAFCWGDGFSGALGNAMKDQAREPFAVKTSLAFKSVVAGDQHTCGLTTTGRVYCWGDGSSGQLGNDGTDERDIPDSVNTDQIFRSIAAGAQHTCGITNSRQLFCWGYNQDGRLGDGTRSRRTVPVAAAPGKTFSLVRAGSGHTCALTTSNQALCWGANAKGQLGSGSTSPFSVTPIVVKVRGGG